MIRGSLLPETSCGREKGLPCHPILRIFPAGEREFDLPMNKARTLDRRDHALKSYLIPAIQRGNLADSGCIGLFYDPT